MEKGIVRLRSTIIRIKSFPSLSAWRGVNCHNVIGAIEIWPSNNFFFKWANRKPGNGSHHSIEVESNEKKIRDATPSIVRDSSYFSIGQAILRCGRLGRAAVRLCVPFYFASRVAASSRLRLFFSFFFPFRPLRFRPRLFVYGRGRLCLNGGRDRAVFFLRPPTSISFLFRFIT